MAGDIYEKIKKFYDEGRDYVFISLWLASELDALTSEIQKLKNDYDYLESRLNDIESEYESITTLKSVLEKVVAEYLTIGKICDLVLERGEKRMKIGEFKTDRGVFNVFIELEEVDSDERNQI